MKAVEHISTKLKSEGRTKAWLASQIGVTRQYVSLMLLGKAPLTQRRLKEINKALKTRFRNEQKEVA